MPPSPLSWESIDVKKDICKRYAFVSIGIHQKELIVFMPKENISFHNIVVSVGSDGAIEIHEKDRITIMKTARILFDVNGEGQILCMGEVIYQKVKNNPVYEDYIKTDSNGKVKGSVEIKK